MPDRIEINGRWANPPSELLHRLYAEARADVGPALGSFDTVAALGERANWQRKVSEAFHARLRTAGIYVEGAR